ncbi:MAG: hypothetical protein PWR20_994 [Bacteroidales bacterium]|jgi:DNA-binding NtrC family response regulator|nr:hypothetical protein [Bacteroidales bacterium]MDN5328327.1 hypothetical protein [Bacteroidales bacterium]
MLTKYTFTAATAEIWLISQDMDLMMETRSILRQEYGQVKLFSKWEEFHLGLEGKGCTVLFVDFEGVFQPVPQKGIEEINWLRNQNPAMVTLFAFGYGNFRTVMSLLGEGIDTWLLKPWDENKLMATFRVCMALALERKRKYALEELGRCKFHLDFQPGPVFSKSDRMHELMNSVVNHKTSCLIFGEPGVGKNWLATWIHTHFNRKGFHILDLSSGAEVINLMNNQDLVFWIKNGWIETLVIDHLQILSEDSIPVFNKQLENFAKQNPHLCIVGLWSVVHGNIPSKELTFFEGGIFELPPLRERKDDIPQLAIWLVNEICQEFRIIKKVLPGPLVQSLLRLPWLGNIPELAQALRNAIAISKSTVLDISDFAFLVSARSTPLKKEKNLRIIEKEKDLVVRALEKHLGNISRAAKELGITRQALYRRMKKYGIDSLVNS